jgi:hypothetical protein
MMITAYMYVHDSLYVHENPVPNPFPVERTAILLVNHLLPFAFPTTAAA